MDWTFRLRLRNLVMLKSLAATGNMSQSAQMLGTSQPALSKWLKELEGDIGLPLFERHARGLRPTVQGAALIAHARRIEAHLDSARDEMHAMRLGGSGTVVLGTSGASAADVVPMAILQLLQMQPMVQARIVESTMDVLIQQLINGEVDVVVGRTMALQPQDRLASEQLYLEPIHLVARTGHPLFEKPSVTWQDLRAYRWLVWPRGTPIRRALESALEAAGEHLPEDRIESNSTTVNLSLLNSSDMIGQVSHRVALKFSELGTIRIVPLPLLALGSVSMFWRPDSEDRMAVAGTLAALRQVCSAATG